MREIDKYSVLKEKLQGICDENNLTCNINNKGYPFLMTIKPLGGIDAQQTMMEGMDSGETGYISSDASLVFAYKDGDLTYKISETWTIGDNLFNKLKNLYKKLHFHWLMYFHRDYWETGPAGRSDSPAVAESAEESAPPAEVDADAFADFMADSAPSGDEEDDTTTEILDGDDSEEEDDFEDEDGDIEALAD